MFQASCFRFHHARWYAITILMEFSRTSGIIILFAFAAAAGFFLYEIRETGADEITASIQAQLRERARRPRPAPLPPAVDIPVSFTAQAPFGDWSQPWQDACEETSVLMAMAWVRGITLTPDLAAEEILSLVDFEEEVFSYHRDTNLTDTLRLFTDFYGYKDVELAREAITAERIKKEVAAGNLVIVPLAGELLAAENPYFTSPPHYHMVVIRGYDDTTQQFVTNEPGTRFGDGFRYSYDLLSDAIHDWTGSPDTVFFGERAMIVVRPVLR